MGTNYYLKQNPCPHCGHTRHMRHIGKSSAGWCFSLHVYPEEGINTLADWEKLFQSEKVGIEDECGNVVSTQSMLANIKERKSHWPSNAIPYGYESREQLHALNHSEDGPNGLLRYRVDAVHCIGHGEGPWDYIVGEFS